jgi:hypothetical protein
MNSIKNFIIDNKDVLIILIGFINITLMTYKLFYPPEKYSGWKYTSKNNSLSDLKSQIDVEFLTSKEVRHITWIVKKKNLIVATNEILIKKSDTYRILLDKVTKVNNLSSNSITFEDSYFQTRLDYYISAGYSYFYFTCNT